VFASETLDYVVDECVQIHGGYGFHQDYAVEHAYRDSRINRIFEGTNEINRLLATGMMLKRAQKGTLPLVEAVKKLQGEILSGPSASAGGPIDLVANAKKAGLLALGVAHLKFGEKIEEQQEVVANITDMLMNAYAMESTQLRTEKIVRSGKNAETPAICTPSSREAMDVIDSAGRTVMAACSEGDTLRTNLAVLKRFTKYEPVNAIALRRQIAARPDRGRALRR
jgi:alkylation response protein AidB-like acyl-CoA dehydrogenase